VQNQLIVLRSGERVFRRLTDSNGRFRLAGLPPGKWTASIEEEGPPAGFEVETNPFVLEVAPGAEATVEFRLVPKVRKIKMLQPLKGVS
jgi:Prealbumin-like fold domain